MPTSSVSASLSWATYIAAAVLLAGAMMPTVQGVSRYSGEAAAVAIADGVGVLLNDLQPGISTILSYHAPSVNISVRFGGNFVVVVFGQLLVSRYCRWDLPNMVLLPETSYTIHVVGSAVEVS